MSPSTSVRTEGNTSQKRHSSVKYLSYSSSTPRSTIQRDETCGTSSHFVVFRSFQNIMAIKYTLSTDPSLRSPSIEEELNFLRASGCLYYGIHGQPTRKI